MKNLLMILLRKKIVSEDTSMDRAPISGSGPSDSPKINACKDKKRGDTCSWVFKGITYFGRCRWLELAWKPTLYCSDRVGRNNEEIDLDDSV